MEQESISQLSEARRQMVEQRRQVIKSLGSSHDREQMEAHINMMMRIQGAIDVIDRVAHEESAPQDRGADGRSVQGERA